jgi:hypothetical protein
MPSEKDIGSLSPIAILRKLDEVMFELTAIKATLAGRKELDAQFVEMRHNYKLISRLMAWVMTPAMVIVVGVVLARMGVSVKPEPAPSSSAERLGPDRVPTPPPPTGTPAP